MNLSDFMVMCKFSFIKYCLTQDTTGISHTSVLQVEEDDDEDDFEDEEEEEN